MKNRLKVLFISLISLTFLSTVISTVSWLVNSSNVILNEPNIPSSIKNIEDYFGTNGSTKYLVSEPQHLKNLSALYEKCSENDINKLNNLTFTLTNDINMGGGSIKPIGSATKPFKATFTSSSERTIFNLKIDGSNCADVGLFGYIDGANISNVMVNNITLDVASANANADVGYLVGEISTGHTSNLSNFHVGTAHIDQNNGSKVFNSQFGYIGRDNNFATGSETTFDSYSFNAAIAKQSLPSSDHYNDILATNRNDPLAFNESTKLSAALGSDGTLKDGYSYSQIGFKDTTDYNISHGSNHESFESNETAYVGSDNQSYKYDGTKVDGNTYNVFYIHDDEGNYLSIDKYKDTLTLSVNNTGDPFEIRDSDTLQAVTELDYQSLSNICLYAPKKGMYLDLKNKKFVTPTEDSIPTYGLSSGEKKFLYYSVPSGKRYLTINTGGDVLFSFVSSTSGATPLTFSSTGGTRNVEKSTQNKVTRAASKYTKVSSLTAGDQVLIVTKKTDYYFLPTTNGSNSAPPVSDSYKVSISNNSISGSYDDHLFTVEADSSNWKFKNGTKYLYTTSDNNGLRIGSGANNTYALMSKTNGYAIKNTSTNRYIGIYNTQDWRSYTSSNHSNYGGDGASGESIMFFKKETKSLSSISISSSSHREFTKGSAFVGETVTATYSDGSTATVTATFSDYNMSNTGTQTVTVSYTEGGVTKYTYYDILVYSFDNITVSTPPVKTEYIAGETFDPTGLIISKNYIGGKESQLVRYSDSPSSFAFNPSLTTFLKTTDNSIAITVEGKTCNQTITVLAPAKTLDSISLDTANVKKDFYINDSFNYTGLVVTANYSDGSSEIVTGYTVSSPTMSSGGNKTVTVTYTYAGTQKTAEYTITVGTVSSIFITNGPAIPQTGYYMGDKLDYSTMVATVTYSNNLTKTIKSSPSSSIEIELIASMISCSDLSNMKFDKKQTNSYTAEIKITYSGVTSSNKIDVTVSKVPVDKVVINDYGANADGNNGNAKSFRKDLYETITSKNKQQFNCSVVSNITGHGTPTYNTVKWESSDENVATINSSGLATFVGTGCTVIKAISNDNSAKYDYCYLYVSDNHPTESAVEWKKVTDASKLSAGDVLVMASRSKGATAGNISDSVMGSVESTFSSDGNKITTLGSNTVQLTLGGSSGAWTLSNSNGKMLGATAVKKVAWGSGTTTWSISITDGSATIQNTNSTYGRFLYNVGSPRFTTYTSGTSTSMLLPELYRQEGGTKIGTSVACSSLSFNGSDSQVYDSSNENISLNVNQTLTLTRNKQPNNTTDGVNYYIDDYKSYNYSNSSFTLDAGSGESVIITAKKTGSNTLVCVSGSKILRLNITVVQGSYTGTIAYSCDVYGENRSLIAETSPQTSETVRVLRNSTFYFCAASQEDIGAELDISVNSEEEVGFIEDLDDGYSLYSFCPTTTSTYTITIALKDNPSIFSTFYIECFVINSGEYSPGTQDTIEDVYYESNGVYSPLTTDFAPASGPNKTSFDYGNSQIHKLNDAEYIVPTTNGSTTDFVNGSYYNNGTFQRSYIDVTGGNCKFNTNYITLSGTSLKANTAVGSTFNPGSVVKGGIIVIVKNTKCNNLGNITIECTDSNYDIKTLKNDGILYDTRDLYDKNSYISGTTKEKDNVLTFSLSKSNIEDYCLYKLSNNGNRLADNTDFNSVDMFVLAFGTETGTNARVKEITYSFAHSTGDSSNNRTNVGFVGNSLNIFFDGIMKTLDIVYDSTNKIYSIDINYGNSISAGNKFSVFNSDCKNYLAKVKKIQNPSTNPYTVVHGLYERDLTT